MGQDKYEESEDTFSKGIDRQRAINSFPSSLICLLCGNILWNPISCKHCKKQFCSGCLQDRCTEGQEPLCPGCKKPGEDIFEQPDTETLELLESMLFSCKNHPYCKDEIMYSGLEDHECMYDRIMCEAGNCGEEVFRKDVSEHSMKCPFVLVQCPHQGMMNMMNKQEIGVQEEVKEGGLGMNIPIPINIPDPTGCPILLPRSEMPQHSKDCTYQKVPCEFCYEPTRIKEIEAHHEFCGLYPEDCPHKKNGCEERVPREEAFAHQERCEFREIICNHCKSHFLLREEDKHMEECSEFERECLVCKVTYKKSNNHQCLLYLSNKVRMQDEKIRELGQKFMDLKAILALPGSNCIGCSNYFFPFALVKCKLCLGMYCQGCGKECSCGEQMCKKCSQICEICGLVFCSLCSKTCQGCKLPICKSCLQTCPKCHYMSCPHCQASCSICSTKGCKICMNKCEICKIERMCENCYGKKQSCDGFHCHKRGCNNCLSRCQDCSHLTCAACSNEVCHHCSKKGICRTYDYGIFHWMYCRKCYAKKFPKKKL